MHDLRKSQSTHTAVYRRRGTQFNEIQHPRAQDSLHNNKRTYSRVVRLPCLPVSGGGEGYLCCDGLQCCVGAYRNKGENELLSRVITPTNQLFKPDLT